MGDRQYNGAEQRYRRDSIQDSVQLREGAGDDGGIATAGHGEEAIHANSSAANNGGRDLCRLLYDRLFADISAYTI